MLCAVCLFDSLQIPSLERIDGCTRGIWDLTKYNLLEFETNMVAKAILRSQETFPSLREVRCLSLGLGQVLGGMSSLERVNDCTRIQWDFSDFECGQDEVNAIVSAVKDDGLNASKQLQKIILDEAKETMEAAQEHFRECGVELRGPS